MKLVAEARHWWRMWSIRLAAVAAAIATAIVANHDFALSLLNMVPDGWRPLAALLTGLLTFIVPALARLIEQPKVPREDQP